MENKSNKTWYQGSIFIDCKIEEVNKSLKNIGAHYKGLVSVYPGVTSVELIEQGEDYVIIKTNEGTMKRTNISIDTTKEKILVEFDEEYVTSKITTNSQFVEIFKAKNDNIELNIKISNLVAPGFLGFFLRRFGSKNIGNGFLNSYKKKLEK